MFNIVVERGLKLTGRGTHTAKIIYMNNVIRKDVGFICYTFSSTGKDISSTIEQILNDAGQSFNAEKGKLYLKRDGKLMALDETTLLDSESISIIYSEVIALQNAARYDEIDGIDILFHMEEGTHLNFPHVHALYAGEEIVVSLIDFQVTGHFKTRKKIRTVVKYIQDNIDDLRREWDRIQNSQLSVKKST